jgi:hypothetical protein
MNRRKPVSRRAVSYVDKEPIGDSEFVWTKRALYPSILFGVALGRIPASPGVDISSGRCGGKFMIFTRA